MRRPREFDGDGYNPAKQVDAITYEPIDPVKSHYVLYGNGETGLYYNTSTLIRAAQTAGGWKQPPHFRDEMSAQLRQEIEEKAGSLDALLFGNRRDAGAGTSGGGFIDPIDEANLMDGGAAMRVIAGVGGARPQPLLVDDDDDDQFARGLGGHAAGMAPARAGRNRRAALYGELDSRVARYLEANVKVSRTEVFVCPSCYAAACTERIAAVEAQRLARELDEEEEQQQEEHADDDSDAAGADGAAVPARRRQPQQTKKIKEKKTQLGSIARTALRLVEKSQVLDPIPFRLLAVHQDALDVLDGLDKKEQLPYCVFRNGAQLKQHIKNNHADSVEDIDPNDHTLKSRIVSYISAFNRVSEELKKYEWCKNTAQGYWSVSSGYNKVRYNRIVETVTDKNQKPDVVKKLVFDVDEEVEIYDKRGKLKRTETRRALTGQVRATTHALTPGRGSAKNRKKNDDDDNDAASSFVAADDIFLDPKKEAAVQREMVKMYQTKFGNKHHRHSAPSDTDDVGEDDEEADDDDEEDNDSSSSDSSSSDGSSSSSSSSASPTSSSNSDKQSKEKKNTKKVEPYAHGNAELTRFERKQQQELEREEDYAELIGGRTLLRNPSLYSQDGDAAPMRGRRGGQAGSNKIQRVLEFKNKELRLVPPVRRREDASSDEDSSDEDSSDEDSPPSTQLPLSKSSSKKSSQKQPKHQLKEIEVEIDDDGNEIVPGEIAMPKLTPAPASQPKSKKTAAKKNASSTSSPSHRASAATSSTSGGGRKSVDETVPGEIPMPAFFPSQATPAAAAAAAISASSRSTTQSVQLHQNKAQNNTNNNKQSATKAMLLDSDDDDAPRPSSMTTTTTTSSAAISQQPGGRRGIGMLLDE